MTGCGGVPKQRVGAQRMVLIRTQKPKNKTISCIGQVGGGYTCSGDMPGASDPADDAAPLYLAI